MDPDRSEINLKVAAALLGIAALGVGGSKLACRGEVSENAQQPATPSFALKPDVPEENALLLSPPNLESRTLPEVVEENNADSLAALSGPELEILSPCDDPGGYLSVLLACKDLHLNPQELAKLTHKLETTSSPAELAELLDREVSVARWTLFESGSHYNEDPFHFLAPNENQNTIQIVEGEDGGLYLRILKGEAGGLGPYHSKWFDSKNPLAVHLANKVVTELTHSESSLHPGFPDVISPYLEFIASRGEQDP